MKQVPWGQNGDNYHYLSTEIINKKSTFKLKSIIQHVSCYHALNKIPKLKKKSFKALIKNLFILMEGESRVYKMEL